MTHSNSDSFQYPTCLGRSDFETGCKELEDQASKSATHSTQTPIDSTTHGAADRIIMNEFGFNNAIKGWVWKEHPIMPGLGYLERTSRFIVPTIPPLNLAACSLDVSNAKKLPDLVDEDDLEAELTEEPDPAFCHPHNTHNGSREITCIMSICYSATYQVPILLINALESSGTPLSLPSLLQSPVFINNSISSSAQTSSDPFLFLTDHPCTGRPCWSLHPCQTSNIVGEVLSGQRYRRVEDGGEVHILKRFNRENGDVSGEVYGDSAKLDGRLDQGVGGWQLKWLQTWLMIIGSVIDLRS